MATISKALRGASRLQDRVAVITGGASGIGKATAEKFVAHGARVIIADIQDSEGEKLAKALGGPDFARYIHCDVSKEDHIARAVDLSVSAFGSLDIMYNNAGIIGPLNMIDQTSAEEIDHAFGVLLRGPILGIKHAARVMKPLQRGNIITTSSSAGHIAGIGPLCYTTYKHGILGLTKAAARELRQHKIRVNCIAPGGIITPIWYSLPSERLESMLKHVNVAEGPPSVASSVGEAEDIANAALYLASDEAKFVTGHSLVVDGSHTLIPTQPLSDAALFTWP